MLVVARWLVLFGPLLVLPALQSQDAPATLPAPLGYVCLRTEAVVTIDGKLDDPAWAAAPWSSDFVDIEGDVRPRPRHRTRMKMLWDARALYIAAELTEPHLWATLKKHDSVIFHDPDFEVFLDPDGDNHLYGELELNALNTTWDLFLPKPYRDGGPAINGWEIIGLRTAVHLDGTLNDPSDTDRGWTVEIAWPWESIREFSGGIKLPPADGERFRINFSRVQWDTDIVAGKYVKVKDRPEHNWVWSPQGAIDMHRPERWGHLQFSTKTSGPVAYQPDPDQALKDSLHAHYYAQRAYRKDHRQYARTMADLAPSKIPGPVPKLEAYRHGYLLHGSDPKSPSGKTWNLSHDGRLWHN